MSILAPYSAISRRPEKVSRRPASLLAALLLFAAAPACVVIDEVEFEDKLNLQPEIIALDPPADRIATVCQGQPWSFVATVRDPDITDPADIPLKAKFEVSLAPYTGKEWVWGRLCEPIEPLEDDDATAERGLPLLIRCDVDLSDELYGGLIIEDFSLVAKLEISDLGYTAQAAREGSRVIYATWFLEVMDCPGS